MNEKHYITETLDFHIQLAKAGFNLMGLAFFHGISSKQRFHCFYFHELILKMRTNQMSLSKQRFHSFNLHKLILKMPTNQISLSVCKQYTLQKSGWLCGRGSVTCICNLTSLYSLIRVAEFSEPLASLQDTGKAKRIRYITRFSLVFTAVSVLSQPVLLNCQGLNLSLHRSIFMSR